MIFHYTSPEGLAQGALFRKNARELRWRLFWHLSSNACHCEPVTDVTGVAIRSSWLPLWGSCHEVTERVVTSPLRLRHLSQRERQVALIRLVLAGDARATFPGGEGMGRRIATAVCALPRNDMVFRQSERPGFSGPFAYPAASSILSIKMP